MSLMQKTLIGSAILMTVILVAVLTRKKISFEAKRNSVFFEMIANVSKGLENLEDGLDNIIAKTENARTKLKQLGLTHKENLVMCALLHGKRKRNLGGLDDRSKTDVDSEEKIQTRDPKKLRR